LTLASPTLVESLIAPSAFRKLCCVDNPAIPVHCPAVLTTERKKKKCRRVNGSRLPKTANVLRSPPSLLYLPKSLVPCLQSLSLRFCGTKPPKRDTELGQAILTYWRTPVCLLKSNSFCPSSDSLVYSNPEKNETKRSRIKPNRSDKSLKKLKTTVLPPAKERI
jgi:hypothetical protein